MTLALGAAGLVLLTDWQGAEQNVSIFGADRGAAAAGKQRSLPYSESTQILAGADEPNEEDIYDLREEAVRMARSICFTHRAWESGDASS